MLICNLSIKLCTNPSNEVKFIFKTYECVLSSVDRRYQPERLISSPQNNLISIEKLLELVHVNFFV
jgi:hypothetical protein